MNDGIRLYRLLSNKLLPVGILIGCALIFSGCGGEPESDTGQEVVRPVKLLSVGGVSSGKTQKLPGVVRASERVELAFQVSGPLIELPVMEGQKVVKGDLIARINPRDFETNLRNAKGTLAKAKASLEYSIAEYERYRNVKKKEPGAVSDSMVSLKRAAQFVAKAELQSAEATVKAARDQLDYTYLYAPFSGIIARKHVDNYQEVTAKQVIVSLQNVDNIEVLVDIPEMMATPMRKVKPSLFAEFAGAPDRRFAIKIKEFATQADPLTQTYQVVLVMPAPEGVRLLSGMTATVVIKFSKLDMNDSDLSIPAIALFADENGDSCVWLVDNGTMKIRKQKVAQGDLTGSDRVRIKSGLKIGDTIAVSGVSRLREGMVVRAYE